MNIRQIPIGKYSERYLVTLQEQSAGIWAKAGSNRDGTDYGYTIEEDKYGYFGVYVRGNLIGVGTYDSLRTACLIAETDLCEEISNAK